MLNPLVSIITPCYNGETFVQRFLESVLDQSYPSIELIFINDGSLDKTEEIVLSYKEKFISRNINLIYIYQNNSGVSAALNRGLEVFTGEYLTWPDSDDILLKDNIKLKVEFLMNHPDCDMVQGKIRVAQEGSLETVLRIEGRENDFGDDDDLFMDLIIENNVVYAPGAYMITKKAFLRTHKNRRIYPSEAGQNWQMLLPIAYLYRCGYIDEAVYKYIVREDSHSRREKNFKKLLQKNQNHKDILLTVIREINMSNLDYYEKVIENKYNLKNYNLSLQYNDKKLMNELFWIVKKERLIEKKDICRYFCRRYSLIYYPFGIGKRVYHMIKDMFHKTGLVTSTQTQNQ